MMKPSEMLQARIDWAHKSPLEPIWTGGPTRNEYVNGLARSTGSYVNKLDSFDDLIVFFRALDNSAVGMVELTAETMPPGTWKEGNTYYVLPVPRLWEAFQAAIPLDKLPEELLHLVRVTKGKHGFELNLLPSVVQAENFPPVRVKYITLICDADGLVTWFPGEVTAPVDLRPATVKLVR